LIEILVADDPGRDVARGDRALVTILSSESPALESVRRWRRQPLVIAKVGAIKPKRFTCGNPIGRAFTVRVAFAIAHHDQRRVALRICLEAVRAGARDDEREVRRVDLDAFSFADSPHIHLHDALRELQLLDSIVDIQKRNVGERAKAQRRVGHLHFAARALVKPQPVAGDERSVDARLHPLIISGWREADRALDLRKPRDTRRRIGSGNACHRERGNAGYCSAHTRPHASAPLRCGDSSVEVARIDRSGIHKGH
jgi:hypothetical protein